MPSKRSEVLFVDYIAEHLTPNGRAAIVVPEGIIFQSQSAYCDLRKMMVAKHLVAVISLPAGVFNPYSGVKTSILILDRAAAKASDSVAFFKIENDGFGLGAQRRAVKGGQLAQVKAELGAWMAALRSGGEPLLESPLGFAVTKKRIAEGGEFNLSGERYRVHEKRERSNYPIVSLQNLVDEGIVTLGRGNIISKIDIASKPGNYPVYSSAKDNDGKFGEYGEFMFDEELITWSVDGGGRLFHRPKHRFSVTNVGGTLRINDEEKLHYHYLYRVLTYLHSKATFDWVQKAHPSVIRRVYSEIPLPPLEVQREIVAEVEGYQKVIDGARNVLENYRPNICIDPDWPKVNLGELCSFASGGTPSKANDAYWIGKTPWVSAKDLKVDKIYDAGLHISEAAITESATQVAPVGSSLVLVRGMGLANGVPICEVMVPCTFNQDLKALLPKAEIANSRFIAISMRQQQGYFRKVMETAAHGTLKLNSEALRQTKISLPPLETQLAIVAEIDAEQALVNANRELITRLENKIETAIARVWGGAVDGEAADNGGAGNRVGAEAA